MDASNGYTQHTRDVDQVLVQCWATVHNAGHIKLTSGQRVLLGVAYSITNMVFDKKTESCVLSHISYQQNRKNRPKCETRL